MRMLWIGSAFALAMMGLAGSSARGNSYTYPTLDNPEGVNGTAVFGINDSGAVVGYYFDADGGINGFLATPVPEPSSLALVSLGAAALLARLGVAALMARRRPGR